MIHNYDQLIAHNAKFYNAFIELKHTGWKSYSRAFNSYTFGFFSTQMKELDKVADDLRKSMRYEYENKRDPDL